LRSINSKKMPLKCHEEILVFYPQLPIYDPQKTTGHPLKVSLAKHKANSNKNQSPCYGKADTFADYASTERFPRSVLKFKSDKQTASIHPTQKPVDLLSYLIKTYSKPGAVILDNVMGSGSIHLLFVPILGALVLSLSIPLYDWIGPVTVNGVQVRPDLLAAEFLHALPIGAFLILILLGRACCPPPRQGRRRGRG